MQDRNIRRYSSCFKQRVIGELEAGRFDSIEAVRRHYGIGGKTTIKAWLKRYGKNHLQAKVVRVETPNEVDQMRDLRQQVARLEQALGRTQAEKVIHEEYLRMACEELGEEVETFKKKQVAGGPRSGRTIRPDGGPGVWCGEDDASELFPSA